jgi:hypothetical protein
MIVNFDSVSRSSTAYAEIDLIFARACSRHCSWAGTGVCFDKP